MTEVALSNQIQKAKLLADSSILPESYRRQPSNLLWAMELAEALDVSLAQAITGITVIQGKPTISAEMMRALVLRAGHRFRVSEMSETSVTVDVARKEWPEDVQQFTFSMTDAQHAGLAGSGTYKKHPKAMLLARATSMACRAVFPDVVSGMGYTPDEIGHDTPPARTVDTSRLTPKRSHSVTVEQVGAVQFDTETGETLPVDTETGEILDAEVLDIEPETLIPEPETEVSGHESGPETPLTADQSHRITVAVKALELGKIDGLALYSEVCGRPIKATRDLTRTEAGLVLAHLETLTDGDG